MRRITSFILGVSCIIFFSIQTVDAKIVVGNSDKSIINTSDVVKEKTNKKITTFNSKSVNAEDFIIQDLELRKIINGSLGKSGEDLKNYSATQADLDKITSLNVQISGMNTYVQIDSFEGIENLRNLTYLTIQEAFIKEEALTNISKLTKLNNLRINAAIFIGNDPNVTTSVLNSSLNGGSIEPKITVMLDNNVDYSALSTLTNLTTLSLDSNGNDQTAAYTYNARTYFKLSGLDNLVNLTELTLTHIPDTDDYNYNFLKSLTNLKKLTIISSFSLKSVDAISTLPNLTSLNINSTGVKDYSKIIDKPYFNAALSMQILDGSAIYYDDMDVNGVNERRVDLDTGIIFGDDISTISFSTVSNFIGAFDIEEYKIVDNKLVLTFSIDKLVNYSLMNYKTGLYDNKMIGFAYGVNVTLNNGKRVQYSLNTLNIGKKVIYNPNYSDTSPIIEKYEPFKAIDNIDINRRGYNFLGWYTDKETTIPYDFNTEQNYNLTLYAKWEEAKGFSIKYDGNKHTSGKAPIDDNIYYDKEKISIKTKETLKKEGYAFVGWNTSKNGDGIDLKENEKIDVSKLNTKDSRSTKEISKTYTLYAKWEKLDELKDPKTPKTGSHELVIVGVLLMIVISSGIVLRKE